MKFSMLGDRENPKVGGGIVLPIPVEVVDHVPFGNFDSKVMQDGTVLHSITSSIGNRMARKRDPNISLRCDDSSPFPRVGVRTRNIFTPHMVAGQELRNVPPPFARRHHFAATTVTWDAGQRASGDSPVVAMNKPSGIASEMPATVRFLHERRFLTATAHAKPVGVRNVVWVGGLSWRCHDCPHDTAITHSRQGGKGR